MKTAIKAVSACVSLAALLVGSTACAQESAALKMTWTLGATADAPMDVKARADKGEVFSQMQAALPTAKVWRVTKGATIKQVLTEWAAAAQWKVEFDPDVADERLGTSDTFSGSLYDAARGLMAAIPKESPIGINLWQGSEVMHVYVR